MLQLIINRQELSYDIYALTQAFYPGVELKIQETQIGQAEDKEEQASTDQMKLYLTEEGGTISMRAGEILKDDFFWEISEEQLSKEAEVFLEEGLENAAARKRAFKNLFYDILTEYTGRASGLQS